ncbi:ABC transporter permease [Melioribacter sp. OK-6-Me]|uniref:ABC transporter permease n=1 Tax=unclassified Melioribacter TaxID=2627329 RepID=UPI003ED9498F
MKKNYYGVKFIITLLFVYLVLFEFILPVNKVLPQPSQILESLAESWYVYNIFQSIASTTSVIYVSMFIAYLLILGILKVVPALFASIELSTVKPIKYVPFVFPVLLFLFWFGASFWGEFLFAFVLISAFLKLSAANGLKNIKKEYLDVAVNLGLSRHEAAKKIAHKILGKHLYHELSEKHYLLWMAILFYEFAEKGNGLGGIYYRALYYNDFVFLFVVTIITTILIWVGEKILVLIEEKYFNWEE